MAIDKRDTLLKRLMARLDQLEGEKAQSARKLAELEHQVSAWRAQPSAGPCPPAAAVETPAPSQAGSVEGPTSRRGLLKAALGAAAATVGAGTLLETQRGTALADTFVVTKGQTLFKSATSTPTVTIQNTSTGLGLSTTNGASLGATAVTSLTASGAVSAASVSATGTVSGSSTSATAAVTGTTNGAAANAAGVYGVISGTAPSSSAAGVWGQNNNTAAAGVGVYGSHAGSGGWAVYGNAPAGFGGVFIGDQTSGSQGIGASGTGDIGVTGNGTTTGVTGTGTVIGVTGNGGYYGVYGNSTSSNFGGIFYGNPSGNGSAGVGVVAAGQYGGRFFGDTTPSSGHQGVYGDGDVGVYGAGSTVGGQFSGDTTAGSGHVGVSGSGDIGAQGAGWSYGGDFYSNAPAGSGNRGVYCAGDIGLDAYGTTWAGYFIGNVEVAGTLSKSGGSFRIDHPLDPAHQYLSHSFVESPDMMNLYNGLAVLDAQGQAVVSLPAWFGTLNRDFRYQLTPLGAAAAGLYIAQEVANNQFAIAGGTPGLKVSWQVTGIRQDPWATANRIVVEQQKPAKEQGTYLYPAGYGAPESQGIAALHRRPQPPTPPTPPKLPAPPKVPALPPSAGQ